MNFKEAKDKLKETAQGEYHCIRYSITETGSGEVVPECNLYINDMDWYEGHTWEAAFAKLEDDLPLGTEIEIDPVEEIGDENLQSMG